MSSDPDLPKKNPDLPKGNALSNVPPPSELPTFVQSPKPLLPVAGLGPPRQQDLAIELTTDFNQVSMSDEIDQQPSYNQDHSLLPPEQDVEEADVEEAPPQKSYFPWQSVPQQRATPVKPSEPSEANPPAPADSSVTPIPEPHEINIMPGTALLSWMKDAVATGGILHKVAEKAKSSVDTMITTLDPQMREYMRSGGDTFIVVASDKDVKVGPIREAFQTAFGKANVVGYSAQSDVTAAQPVGYAVAYAAAKQRIAHVRSAHAELPDNAPIVAIEAFLHEAVPDKWYDISLLVLSQPTLAIELQVQSQGTPVPGVAVAALRESTPKDYAHAQTGFSKTVGAVMGEQLKVPHTQWHEAATGVSRMELLSLAAKSLAVQYKRLLESMSSNET